MPGNTQNGGHSAWQLIGIIVITATLSSAGSGVVSGYLAARAVADQVTRDQGRDISMLDNRITAIEIQVEESIKFRLSRLEADK